MIGKHVDAAAVNFEQTRRFFRNAEVTGVPVREAFFSLPERVNDGSQHLLVFGGSMGARALNQAMPRVVASLLAALPRLTILHQAGAKHVEATQAAYAASGADPSRWEVRAFLDDMPARFANADLILCRSGSSVAELAAAGKPSLLVPFPFAADDHQHKNALIFAEAGAAVLLPESELTDERLTTELTGLLGDPARLREMGSRARTLAHPDALQRIAADGGPPRREETTPLTNTKGRQQSLPALRNCSSGLAVSITGVHRRHRDRHHHRRGIHHRHHRRGSRHATTAMEATTRHRRGSRRALPPWKPPMELPRCPPCDCRGIRQYPPPTAPLQG